MIQYNFDDSRIGATIEAYMNGYQDPRRGKYFVATAKASTTAYAPASRRLRPMPIRKTFRA